MQDKVYNFVKEQVLKKEIIGKTLDVGSKNVNGSLRPLFTDYVGLDMRKGRNVDIIANSHNIPFDDGTFDCVTCVETLEHDDNPFETMNEIYRILKPGGWAVLAASGINFKKHAHPNDYFRYTDEGMKVLLKKFNKVEGFDDSDEAYGIGQKAL